MGLRIDHPAYRYAAWAGIVILAALAVAAWGMGKAWGAVGLCCSAAAGALFIHWRDRLPPLFSLLFVVAGLLNGLGWVFDFWDRVPYFDPVTHAYTTFAVTLALGFLTYYSVTVHFREHAATYVLSIASLGLALGALWEVFEWAMEVPQSYRSVVVDLVADTVGAVFAGLLAAYAIRTESPPRP